MSDGLVERLGLSGQELISVVGAGGKSTLVACLGREYAQAGRTVILTTTTKMGADQLTEPKILTTNLEKVQSHLTTGERLFVVADVDGSKVIGIPPEFVNQLFTETAADVVVVEADGARRRRFKAPADHEPVIPDLSTTVVVVAGAAAIGEPIRDVAHRPERVADLAGVEMSDVLTPTTAASVLLHPEGGRKNVPVGASVHYAISTTAESAGASEALIFELLRNSPDASVHAWSLGSEDLAPI
ncbi:MAG: selenium cofactor biosynthesis protein YqeC [Acidimicrobiia bacterium]